MSTVTACLLPTLHPPGSIPVPTGKEVAEHCCPAGTANDCRALCPADGEEPTVAPGAVGTMGQMLQMLSGVSGGSWPLPAPKPWETSGFHWQGGEHSLFGGNCFAWGILLHLSLLPIRDWSFRLSSTHSVCQSWQTAEENLQAHTGATAGAVLCPRLQSRVPLGGPACPHCTGGVSIPLQLTHHSRGKAGGGSWPHTEHSTDPRQLQQSAPSPPCSYTPDAITTHRDR